MDTTKTPENYTKEYVANSLKDFLANEPGCTLDWIKGRIMISEVDRETLKSLLKRMKGYGDRKKYEQIFTICENAGFHRVLI
jgi:hypothetical protein